MLPNPLYLHLAIDSDSHTHFLTAKVRSSGASVLKQSDSFIDVSKYRPKQRKK